MPDTQQTTPQTNGSLDRSLDAIKALADANRLELTLLIADQGELCVCELVVAVQQPQAKISRNLALLRRAEILLDRRQGKWVHYQLNPSTPDWIKQMLTTIKQTETRHLNQQRQRLEQMGDRPQRLKNCCPSR
ncbi:metalloregulator ArsR/SmtB family transcription factor [Neiella sp. HB171785]|uniref:Metalloregulator ArsR/SmtB family transcription factor n=1 Tax=Neiella litorisoli TaxID=2771431 RepID=A0A8J6UEP5_9GAMM|nr:metalloregulator ArsR/SmtB family transcription factor [Neiella litorisoli]MBD1387946.1 metalloregulator ArsR/SmtB family transcription factor [Neiella litorisoli]